NDLYGDVQLMSRVRIAGVVLVTTPSVQAKDLKEVIAQAKANPGKLNFGSPGVGSTQHFAAEYMKQLAGLDIQHVPYRSTPAALTGLLAGEVQLVVELAQSAQAQ